MYATLGQVSEWVAEARGLCLPDDRDEVVKLINKIRAEFYVLPHVHWTVPLCLPVSCFCEPCPHCEPCDCNTSNGYAGITVPPGFINIINAWFGRRPVNIIDRWAIYPWDSEWESCDCMNVRDMGDGFVFQADPPCTECVCLLFNARNREDVGKIITIRYYDANDRLREEEHTLTDAWGSTQREIKQILPQGISLPKDLKGEVVVRDQNQKEIAVYQPWEVVPNYRRFKLSGCAASYCGTVSVIAQRDGSPLYNDADVLETGNRLIWENAARWLHLHEKTNADGADQANEAKFYGKFSQALGEEARRRRGLGKRFAIRFRGWSDYESALGVKRGVISSRSRFRRY